MKITKEVGIGIGIVTVITLLSGCNNSTNAEIYPQYSVVVNTDAQADIVTVECKNGQQYQFEGIEDWMEGDICSLLMDTNGTDIVTDDKILKAEYDGYEW